MNGQSDGPAPSNAFLQVLQMHNGGQAANDMADAQKQCMEAAELTGKPATVTFTVRYTKAARGAFAVLFTKPKLKLPEMDEPVPSLWFGDGQGNLSRQDPRQRELPLKTVTGPVMETQLRDVVTSAAVPAVAAAGQ